VIVPVYNAEDNIEKLVRSLLAQTYPKDRYEVIIVDNHSTDNTLALLRKHKDITVLEEVDIQSSYAARNKGLRQARGEIIAFTDSDCVADARWLAKEAEAVGQGADVVGGAVTFVFSAKPTLSELYDSISHLTAEAYVKRKRVVGANLVVRKTLFDAIGPFPSHFKSGGDFWWTGKADKAGYRFVYAPDAVIYHPARKFDELAEKVWRVGKAYLCARKDEGWKSLAFGLVWTLRLLLPQNPFYFRKKLQLLTVKIGFGRVVLLYGVSYVFDLLRFCAAFFSLKNIVR
jgi:glycosyltransferase involved in cell wall biosynthesis